NIPRGSSSDEMGPYLDTLVADVARVRDDIAIYLGPTDTNRLKLDDLISRGLMVPDADKELYEQVVADVAAHLASQGSCFAFPQIRLPSLIGLTDPATRSTEMRRLDDSIREEQNLHGRKTILESEVTRVITEIERLGRPAGVTSAIVILSIYSVLGI